MQHWYRKIKPLIFTLIIISAFFILLEAILSLVGIQAITASEDPFVGYSSNEPLFVERREADGTTYLETAENKQRLFNYQRFSKEKPANGYRIYCMGGSTTLGRPYNDNTSFCGWLRAYLNVADPSRNWEVINAGGISYASYRVANLTEELAQYQPDLFIVYTGQNEFLEQRSYGRLIDLPTWLLDSNSILSGTRTYGAIWKTVAALQGNSAEQSQQRYQLSGEVDEVLRHTAGPTSYKRDDMLRHQIINHYRYNLGRIIRIARESGAETMMVKPAINIKDMSPFKSEHKPGLSPDQLAKWQTLHDAATLLYKEGLFIEALAKYKQTQAIDERYAETHFRIGKILFSQQRYIEAEESFRRAVNEDIAPLRILAPMQEIVAEVVSAERTPLVDFPEIIRAAYQSNHPHTVFGKEFFLDHVHTTIDGYRLLALALLEKMTQEGIVTPTSAWNGEAIAKVNNRTFSRLDHNTHGLALRNLGKVLDWAGKFDEAELLFKQGLKIQGPTGRTLALLGKTALRNGKPEEALNYFRQAVSVDPNIDWVHRQLGLLLTQRGKIDEAIHHYLEDLRIDPNNFASHDRLAVLLAMQQRHDLAYQHFTEALRLNPDYEPAHLNLAILLFKQHQYEKAEKHANEVLRINPNEYQAYNHLGIIYAKQGKFDEAADYFSEALNLRPEDEKIKRHLEKTLSLRDQKSAAATP